MRIVILSIMLLFCAVLSAFPGESNPAQLPDMLKVSYEKFTQAMKSGDAGAINQYCLPQSVSFTYEARKDPEYGQDLNVVFAKNNFDGAIVSVRKELENCYLIRTNTTALWFVETKSMGWKLYKYFDKPIE